MFEWFILHGSRIARRIVIFPSGCDWKSLNTLQRSLCVTQSVRWHSGEQYLASRQPAHLSPASWLQMAHLAKGGILSIVRFGSWLILEWLEDGRLCRWEGKRQASLHQQSELLFLSKGWEFSWECLKKLLWRWAVFLVYGLFRFVYFAWLQYSIYPL